MNEHPPGPLEEQKHGPTVRGEPQPEAAETESARLLANDARAELIRMGLSDAEIDRLADRFIAEDRGTATEEFVDWVRSSTRGE